MGETYLTLKLDKKTRFLTLEGTGIYKKTWCVHPYTHNTFDAWKGNLRC